MTTAIELIEEERHRQATTKGFDAKHDDSHKPGELSDVGGLLAIDADTTAEVAVPVWGAKLDDHVRGKYGDVRRLVIAAALIAAEIDRRLRAGEKP